MKAAGKSAFFLLALTSSLCAEQAVELNLEQTVEIQEIAQAEVKQSPGLKNQANTYDQEIDKLINQRNLYLAKATRLQNQGDRLQFEPNNLIDARRAWQQAQINREIATRIQEEINTLEKQRKSFFETHGFSYKPRDEMQ